DAGHTYWAEGLYIWRYTLGFGAEIVASTSYGPEMLAIDETYLYWLDGGHLYRLAKDSPGLPPVELTRAPARYEKMVVADGFVYWLTHPEFGPDGVVYETQGVYASPLDGGP